MKFLFFNHDGNNVSGVHSYCKILLSCHPDCLTISLNEKADVLDQQINHRFYRLSIEKSHIINEIVDIIEKIANQYSHEMLILLPNNGDIPFIACLHALEKLKEPHDRLRILATIHCDHPDSYAMPVRYSRQIAKFIGVSSTITDALRSMLPNRHRDVYCLPCPVNISAARSQTAFNLSVPLRIMYAGRLEEQQKHVSRLLLVAAKLGEMGIPFALDIYGDGKASSDLARTISRLPVKIQKKVRLMGRVSEEKMCSLMANYDLLLLVSSYEGTPLVLLEGMASGLCPVVMAIQSGVPELITNGINGVIVPQGDTESMAEAICALHRDRNHLNRLKNAALAGMGSNYSLLHHLNCLNEILQACAAMPVPPSIPTNIAKFDAVVSDLIDRLNQSPESVTVVWGGGMYGRSVVDASLKKGITIHAIIDIDPKKQELSYRGVPYLQPERLTALAPTLIVIGSVAFSTEIYQHIQRLYNQATLPYPAILKLQENT